MYGIHNLPVKVIKNIKRFLLIQDTINRETNDTIIPVHLFNERTNVGIRLPFCPKNEFDSRKLIRKLNSYTHVVYKATCNNCDIQYIGETARNLETRVEEHEDVRKTSESARHIKSNPPSNRYALSALLYADE